MTKAERVAIELERLRVMKEFDREAACEFFGDGCGSDTMVCGIDEVGRGPLAGPVCAAAVILPPDFDVPGINDSKKVSEKRREALYKEITERAVAWSVALVDNTVIDEINILEATKRAMKLAVSKLEIRPDLLVIDAVKLENLDIPQKSIVKGDEKSLSVAAASIVAKVTRDRLMVEYSEKWPGYGFEKNKGYGTKAHYEGIEKQGIAPVHRLSYLKNIKI